MGPLKATNKPVSLHSLEVFKVTNGKTTRGWSYSNSGELLTQVGLMPAMGAAKTETTAKPVDIKKPANPAPKGTSPAPSKK